MNIWLTINNDKHHFDDIPVSSLNDVVQLHASFKQEVNCYAKTIINFLEEFPGFAEEICNEIKCAIYRVSLKAELTGSELKDLLTIKKNEDGTIGKMIFTFSSCISDISTIEARVNDDYPDFTKLVIEDVFINNIVVPDVIYDMYVYFPDYHYDDGYDEEYCTFSIVLNGDNFLMRMEKRNKNLIENENIEKGE